jgi:hypothetical protein
MLNQEGTKKGSKVMVADIWTEDEFDLIAVELKQRFPDRKYSNMYRLEFTENEVEEAAEAVLPQSRHKSVHDYLEVRRPLFNAFTRIAQPVGKRPALKVVQGKSNASGHVMWSPQEWEVVLVELNRLYPDLFQERLKTLGISHIRAAMEVLDVPRRRQFKQLVGFRESAMKIWEGFPIEVRDPSKQVRPIIDFESGPVMAPPVTSKTKENPMAAAMQKAFVQAETENEKKERKSPVHWKSYEWVTVAREMHRQNPHANHFISGFFKIDLEAIRLAQRVLPFNRRRMIRNSIGLQKPLVDAFKALSLEMMEEENAKREAMKAFEPVPEMQEETAPDVVEVEKESPVEQPVSQETKAEFVPLTSREIDFFGKVMNAALPLMNVLIDEAVSRLAPSLIAGMLPQLEKSLGGMIERAVAAQTPKADFRPQILSQSASASLSQHEAFKAPSELEKPLSKAEIAQYLPQPTEKPRKPKIALLMPLGQQREYVRAAFPEYEFVFIDHGQGIKEAGQNCVLFIAVDNFVTGPNQKSMKAHVPPEKLKYVEGGLTSIKRQINVWKASQTA